MRIVTFFRKSDGEVRRLLLSEQAVTAWSLGDSVLGLNRTAWVCAEMKEGCELPNL